MCPKAVIILAGHMNQVSGEAGVYQDRIETRNGREGEYRSVSISPQSAFIDTSQNAPPPDDTEGSPSSTGRYVSQHGQSLEQGSPVTQTSLHST